ncbi:RNA polymerase sigma factor [Spirosoma sp.]|uniref:RNA polymerase sigma factor n=2 Tax=unclassified Spirosoma TaxID=2621999 RepID=UPI00096280A3|nr:RNA polymerase sigma-70 factor [Spirosoma sp.]MBN8822372.1 RNA polymerase sigma-70 factor [Spirosoma sp.]OJW72331.1 MAG: RNA polymerase subunit sigma-70 [Spirosoma sp. 48-14]
MTFPNENFLLNRMSTGDEKAFRKLYDFYRPDLYRFVFKFIKSNELSNDICQEVFMKIWEDRWAIQEVSSFKSYLFTITKNHTFNMLKRAAVEDRIKGEVLRNYTVSKNDTEESLQAREYQQFLQRVLDTLPPQSREVFKLCRQQEKSYDEAAQILGISSSAIKKHMVRSMKVLKFAVEKDMGIAFSVFMQLLAQSGDWLPVFEA